MTLQAKNGFRTKPIEIKTRLEKTWTLTTTARRRA